MINEIKSLEQMLFISIFIALIGTALRFFFTFFFTNVWRTREKTSDKKLVVTGTILVVVGGLTQYFGIVLFIYTVIRIIYLK